MSIATTPAPVVVRDSSWTHLRGIIEHTILTDPRTLQVALGPSEIGVPTPRIGTQPQRPGDPSLAAATR